MAKKKAKKTGITQSIRRSFKKALIALGTWFFDTSENIALLLPEPMKPKARKAIAGARSQARRALERGSFTRVFLENLGYRTTLNAITKGIMFFLTLWLTRVLSPQEFGLYSFTISTAMLFAVFASFGIPTVVTKKVPEFLARGNKEEARKWVLGAFLVETFTALSVFVILFLSSQWLAVNLFHKPFTRGAIKLAGGFIFVYVMAGLVDQIFVSLKRNDLSLKVGLFREITKVLAIVSLVYLGFSYMGAVYGYMLGFFVFLLVGIGVLVRKYNFLLVGKPENPTRIISYAWWFLALGLSATILSMTDVFMISIFLPIQYAGYYKVAISLVSTTLFLIPIGAITMPLLSEATSKKELDRRFRKIFYPTVGFSLGVAVLVAIFGKPVLALLYPPTYVDHAWFVLMVLAFLIPAKNAFWLNAQRLIVLGKEKEQLLVTGLAAGLNIILNAVLIPALGLVGAALASVLSLVIGVVVIFVYN